MSPFYQLHPKLHPGTMNHKCGTARACAIPHCDAGAGGGTRTRTDLRPRVFKTPASAISPLRRVPIIPCRVAGGNSAVC